MGTIVGGFLIVFGLLWTGILYSVSHSIGAQGASFVGPMLNSMMAVGAVIFAIGVILLITGLIQARGKKQMAMEIFQRGTLVKGTVTFVDKNYRLLVNNAPIFSIVEFTFQDARGATHTSRKPDVSSELVIRDSIVVGGQVAVKYLPENPDLNILILKDPNAPPASAAI